MRLVLVGFKNIGCVIVLYCVLVDFTLEKVRLDVAHLSESVKSRGVQSLFISALFN